MRMTDEMANSIAAKIATLRTDFEAAGLECTFFWRAPGSAQEPVAFLMVGASAGDIEAAHNAFRH